MPPFNPQEKNYAVRILMDAALRGRKRGARMASGAGVICEHSIIISRE